MKDQLRHLGDALRGHAYQLYRRTKPEGWTRSLSVDQLEREIDRWYFSLRGTHIDFRHPQTFAEKMQWLKIYDRDPRKTTLSDKLAVRPTVESVAGSAALPQVYGVWDSAESIDFAGIDKPFFFKCTNGSGMMARVDDPATADVEALRTQARAWLARDFASEYFELHYADITPRVFAEERLDDIEWEYQAWCFSGEVAFIAAIHDPHGINEKQFFSPSWEKLPFVSSPPEYAGTVAAPECLEQIVDFSQQLARDFVFVRVDWYGTRHGLMFSEMSFTPAYGIVHWQPADYDAKVGQLIHLPIED